jgi:hypothetical protein
MRARGYRTPESARYRGANRCVVADLRADSPRDEIREQLCMGELSGGM